MTLRDKLEEALRAVQVAPSDRISEDYIRSLGQGIIRVSRFDPTVASRVNDTLLLGGGYYQTVRALQTILAGVPGDAVHGE
jgi:hypothetical protein